MDDELYDSPQDMPNEDEEEDSNEEDLSESEESKHEHPQKRQKTEYKSSLFDTTKPHEVIGNSVLMVAHTDAEAIE